MEFDVYAGLWSCGVCHHSACGTLLWGGGVVLQELLTQLMLLGGGVGVPPLYMLAKRLIAEGNKVHVVLGFNTASEVFYEKEFAARQKEYNEFFTRRIAELEKRAESSENRLKAVTEALRG